MVAGHVLSGVWPYCQ